MLEFIFVPWIMAVVILFITVLSFGSSWVWVVVPALLACGICVHLAWDKYKKSTSGMAGGEMALAIFYLLCAVGSFAAFIVSLITYLHFLQPYHELGGGATYLDMLPSQSALAASDATAIVFAQGTGIDMQRTYGFVDARHPEGTMYCVAPVSNQWTVA